MPAYPARWRDYPPWPDRLLERIIVLESGCWLLDHRGDRGVAPTVRQIVTPPPETGIPANQAYRVVWEFFYGPVGFGFELYCGCGETHCVKPGHRIALTRAEIARIVVWRKFGYDPEEQCGAGHPREEFGYRIPNGRLRCRRCDRDHRRAHRQANPEMQRLYDRQRKRRRAGWPTVE